MIMNQLAIYINEQEFYQVRLHYGKLHYDLIKKGGICEFKSYAYSYVIGRMKSALREERMK